MYREYFPWAHAVENRHPEDEALSSIQDRQDESHFVFAQDALFSCWLTDRRKERRCWIEVHCAITLGQLEDGVQVPSEVRRRFPTKQAPFHPGTFAYAPC